MPSIPQSLLWISLVVLWLFVLVPMLISKRDAVRRTSDVALATRVLNTGAGARLLRRGRPAAGHHSDPDWQPSNDDVDDDLDEEPRAESTERAVVRVAAVQVETDTEPDYLDVDVVDEDSGALPVGASASETEPAPQTDELPLDFGDEAEEAEAVEDPDEDEEDDPAAEYEPDGTEDEYEYVDDSSGLEAPSADDERLLKEVVYFADRSDITEELTRLQSHFQQFDDCLKSTEPVGRLLDFLAQEMNREVNTIGSKANDSRISREVVKLKAELERFREQAQNVE